MSKLDEQYNSFKQKMLEAGATKCWEQAYKIYFIENVYNILKEPNIYISPVVPRMAAYIEQELVALEDIYEQFNNVNSDANYHRTVILSMMEEESEKVGLAKFKVDKSNYEFYFYHFNLFADTTNSGVPRRLIGCCERDVFLLLEDGYDVWASLTEDFKLSDDYVDPFLVNNKEMEMQ